MILNSSKNFRSS